VEENPPWSRGQRKVGTVIHVFGAHTIRDVVAVRFGRYPAPAIAVHADDLRLARRP
jgi:hypothetical protein